MVSPRKMYFLVTLYGILLVFIVALYCDDSLQHDEIGRILVPTAPVNVTIRSVTGTDIQLSWARPISTQKTHHNSKSSLLPKSAPPPRRPQEDSVLYQNEKDGTLVGLLSDVRPSEYGSRFVKEYYQREQTSLTDQDDQSDNTFRSRRSSTRKHRRRRQESTTAQKVTNADIPTTVLPLLDVSGVAVTPKELTASSQDETQPSINYVLYVEEGGMQMDGRGRGPVISIGFNIRANSVFLSDRSASIDNFTGHAKNVTLREDRGRKGKKGYLYTLRSLKPFTPYKVWVRAYFVPNLSTLGDRAYAEIPSLHDPSGFGSIHAEDVHLDADVIPRLGPSSEPLFVLTDVIAPTAPRILNLTCQQPPGTLYVQWKRPDAWVNTIDYYFVKIRRISAPDLESDKPRKNYSHSVAVYSTQEISFDTSKEHTETAFSLVLEQANNSIFEVTIVAATKSVIVDRLLLNSSETETQLVRMSPDCVPVPLAMSPPLPGESPRLTEAGFAPDPLAMDGTIVSLVCILVLVLLLLGIVAILIYWRSRLTKCLSAAYSYLEDGGAGDRIIVAGPNARKYCRPLSNSPRRSNLKAPAPDPPPSIEEGEVTILRLADSRRPPVPRSLFALHVSSLHADGDIGFSKEYELVQVSTTALGHTSHYSQLQENRPKNRYLNIIAYDHTRVCLLPGSTACCPDQKETKKHMKDGGCTNCNYINANFIDGIVGSIDENLKEVILKKHQHLEERKRRKAAELEAQQKAAPIKAPVPREASVEPAVVQPSQPIKLDEAGNEIESAFLNIEFSGIVESEDEEEANKNIECAAIPSTEAANVANIEYNDDENDELDDLHVDIDGRKVQIRSEWLMWKKRYIATQGPTPSTLDAFWRMVWDHATTTIVMITNLIERGRRKCDMYWPKEGTMVYGVIEVTIIHEDIMATYTVRTFQIKHIKQSSSKKSSVSRSPQESSLPSEAAEVRIVRQFHYTVWPDHGTPDHPLSVLHFVREAGRSAASTHTGGGVLVHCSAGVGRTGTYIVLDAMLNHLLLTGTINIFGFLCHVRTQRNFLVQTEEQYIFIHAALLEAIQSGETNVPIVNMKEYLKDLLSPLPIEPVEVKELKKIEGDYVNLNGREMEMARLADESLTDGSTSTSKPRMSASMVAEANSSTDSLKMNGNASASEKHSHDDNMDASDLNLTDANVIALGKGYNSRSESNLAGTEKPEFRPLSNCLDTRKVIFLNGIRNDSKSDTNDDSKDISNEECVTEEKCIYAVNESRDAFRRKNRDENYELLERMWSISSNGQRQRDLDDSYQPKNLLEKQFKLLRRCSAICGSARALHNEDKNRRKAIFPADASRVLLVPRPGQEGSDYINAVWMQGRRRVREFVSAQHPPLTLTPPSSPIDGNPVPVVGPPADFWRMLWDHTCQVVVILSDVERDPQCERFWPTAQYPQEIYGNYRVCYLSQKKFAPKLKKYTNCQKCHRPHSSNKTQSESPNITMINEKTIEKREPEMNGYGEDHVNSFYHRQGSIENQDEERLISPKVEESAVEDTKAGELNDLLDRSQLRIENLNKNKPDFGDSDNIKMTKLSARKSIANGDLFASFSESKKGAAGPKSPSKMSLKNFKIGSPVLKSPTKFKFPDFTAKFSTEKTDAKPAAPEPREIRDPLNEEFETCFDFIQVETGDDPHIIVETTVSMHSLQDDYELTVKVVECPHWMADEEIQSRLRYEVTDAETGTDGTILNRLRTAFCNGRDKTDESADATIDEFLRPLRWIFTLPEFIGRCQMEFKNSPVVVVDKFGGARCSTLCALNTAAASVASAARDPVASKVRAPDSFVQCVPSFDAYACAALHACRRGVDTTNTSVPNASVWSKPGDILGVYASLAAYGELLKEIGFGTPLCQCQDAT